MSLIDQKIKEFEEKFTFDANKGLRLENKFEIMGKDTAELKSFLCTALTEVREETIKEVGEKIKGLVEKHRGDISLNKGTWMSSMENYFEGMELVVKDLEKLLSAFTELTKKA